MMISTLKKTRKITVEKFFFCSVKTSFKQFSINHNYEKLKEQSLEHSDEEKTTEKLITKVCVGELPSPIKTYNRKRERNSSHDENDIRSKRQKISISDSGKFMLILILL